MTSYLCKCIGVSKSGYYSYLKNENKRIERDNKDQKYFDLIVKAYKFKKRKKGARQIMMVLDNEFNTHFNLKKIRRLMKKYGLKCPIRQANPYRTTDITPTWIYDENYTYWTMSSYNDSTSNVWEVSNGGNLRNSEVFGYYSGGAVRPVIVLSKSVL